MKFNNSKIKSLLQQTKKEAFFMGFLPQEKVEIEISASIETACWSFTPPHRIVVGDEVSNSKKSANFIQALLWHELSHARWTERDIEKINRSLKDKEVPFELFNLFEDARIEHLYRQELGQKFNWTFDVPTNKEAITPVETFYSFVHNEGVYKKEVSMYSIGDTIDLRLLYIRKGRNNSNTIFSINNKGEFPYYKIKALLEEQGYSLGQVFYTPDASVTKSHVLEESRVKSRVVKAHGKVQITTPDDKIVELLSYETSEPLQSYEIDVLSVNISTDNMFKKVAEFYNKACNAQNSMEVIDICAEWLEEFPSSKNDPMLNDFDQDTREGRGDIMSPDKMKHIYGDSIDGVDNTEEVLSKGSKEAIGHILKGNPETFDETRLNKLTQLFKGIIKRGMVKYNSIVPSKKINIRNYTLGSDKIFKNSQNDNGKSEKLSVILDCSGSMFRSHLYAGKEFLIIINRLAKQGLVRGNIILTESSEQVLLPMPVDENLIRSIQTGGGEGFKTTIKKYENELKTSGKVFVFTDGEIGDEPDSDYNRKLGIKTYGLYVGKNDQTKQLLKYFDFGISKETLEDVILEMLKKVK